MRECGDYSRRFKSKYARNYPRTHTNSHVRTDLLNKNTVLFLTILARVLIYIFFTAPHKISVGGPFYCMNWFRGSIFWQSIQRLPMLSAACRRAPPYQFVPAARQFFVSASIQQAITTIIRKQTYPEAQRTFRRQAIRPHDGSISAFIDEYLWIVLSNESSPNGFAFKFGIFAFGIHFAYAFFWIFTIPTLCQFPVQIQNKICNLLNRAV